MLKITETKKSKGTMDALVKNMVQQACKLWDEMDDLKRLFDIQIRQIKKVSFIAPQFAYKLIQTGDNTIELWHIEPVNMNPDRLLLKIEYHSDFDESNLS